MADLQVMMCRRTHKFRRKFRFRGKAKKLNKCDYRNIGPFSKELKRSLHKGAALAIESYKKGNCPVFVEL